MKRLTLLICFLLSISHYINGQSCGGTLGDNLFLDGDFGTGTANIPPTDPGLAPSFIYRTASPVLDGEYTLTNDMSQWTNTLGWITISDNSADPNGYMMVVNADFDPGLFYEKQITGLCENTLFEFSADIFNLIRPQSNLILPNVSFLINNQVVFNTGDIPENATWNKYAFTFSTQPGQTSLTLALRNNAPGGMGNDLAIDNISFRPCGPDVTILPTTNIALCENDSAFLLNAQVSGSQYPNIFYQWQQSNDGGNTFNNITGANNPDFIHSNFTPSSYYYRLMLANSAQNLNNPKCVIYSTAKTIEVLPVFFFSEDTICEDKSYQFGNQNIQLPGTYTETFSTSRGCDSIVELKLEHTASGQFTASVEASNPLCNNSADGQIEITNILNGNGPFINYVNGNSFEGKTATNLRAGDNTIEVLDRFQCSWKSTITLENPELFEVQLFEDTSILLGQPLFVKTKSNFPISRYTWEPPFVFCEFDCEGFQYTIPRSLNLKAMVFNENNCMATDEIEILVNPERYLHIPTAFSPNRDGNNDYFFPVGMPEQISQIDKFQIFDKWGNEIVSFTNLPYTESPKYWDGTTNGNDVPIGSYAYKMKIRFIDDVVLFRKGSVTLFR